MGFRWLWSFLLCIAALGAFAQQNEAPRLDTLLSTFKKGAYERAVPMAEKWCAAARRRTRETATHASVLYVLGESLRKTGRFDEAKPALLHCLNIRRKKSGETSLEAAATCFSLGHLYRQLNLPDSALAFYEESLKIRALHLGPSHDEVASVLYSIGSFHAWQGHFAQAESYYLQSVAISKLKGEYAPGLADAYNGLSVLYNDAGDYQKAEEFGLKSLKICEMELGPHHLKTALTANSLGTLYERMGNFARAEPYFLRCMQIWKAAYGEASEDVADACNNLGALYIEWAKPKLAEEYLTKGLKIKEVLLGENHIQIGSAYLNMGNFYYVNRKYGMATDMYRKALKIYTKHLGPTHPELADVYNNLAAVSRITGNQAEAETMYQASIQLFTKNLGPNHPRVVTSYNRMGALCLELGDNERAESFFRHYLTLQHYLLKRYFPFLSDDEKEKFLAHEQNYLEVFKWFCVERYRNNPTISSLLYDQQLTDKALLLNSSAKWRRRIKALPDSGIQTRFKKWEENQGRIVALVQAADTGSRKELTSLQSETEQIEKELARRSGLFSKLADTTTVGWMAIKRVLKPGEAAVEMIRIRKYGVADRVEDTLMGHTETRKVKGLTDSIVYVALVIKPESVQPEMVVLKNGNDLETKALRFYRKCIQREVPDRESYLKFWAPIAEHVASARKIFFSPDGVFHLINLNTLLNPKTMKYVLDEKDIAIVTSTKDLVTPRNENKTQTASLIGFPTYRLGAAHTENPWREIQELPATRKELDTLQHLLRSSGSIQKFTGREATEGAIKTQQSPAILHIATHGFFRNDSAKQDYPLLKSGLLLAGAASNGADGEDGVLYASEAMNLNLDSTELVVLSACETGLGEVRTGEGVYGLQRAFKVAGARSVIMSLWKVSDRTTLELMVSFYRNWSHQTHKGGIKSPTLWGGLGGAKRTAFLAAQKELKAKYPNPYYWGAFVMVGE